MNRSCLLTLLIVIITLSACASLPSTYSADRPPLHQAALTGKIDVLKQLLSQGVNINELDSGGFAALHWAATTPLDSGPAMVKALLKAGANPDILQRTAKMTPLFFAANGETVKALIDGGANINARNINQATPLHNAKTADAVTVLINNGADINAVNAQGQTPRASFEATLAYMNTNPAYESLIDPIKQKILALGGNQTQATSTLAKTNTSAFIQTTKKKSTRAEITERILRMDKLIAAQPCKMKHEQWIYTGDTCQNSSPEGNGTAVHKKLDLLFVGTIKAGSPIYGELLENNLSVYEGDFKNGFAHGNGVCYYQNEPEECRYFKGKRIDTLFKQRQEFERQQATAKITTRTLEKQQKPAESNALGDAVEDQLLEQGAKFIFDSLF